MKNIKKEVIAISLAMLIGPILIVGLGSSVLSSFQAIAKSNVPLATASTFLLLAKIHADARQKETELDDKANYLFCTAILFDVLFLLAAFVIRVVYSY
jgi:hypothetical protein